MMNIKLRCVPRLARRARVIALHCSGAGAGQWRRLAEVLGEDFELLAPEHYGTANSGPWSGEHAFALADEAARTIALIDNSETNVHLAGHSYGGGVALHVALARPDRIASLSLYEPSAFHLLRRMGKAGARARAEIAAVTRRVGAAVNSGDCRSAAGTFVDYWNGRGAFAAMPASLQSALIRWAPKAPLDFRALLNEPGRINAYRMLNCPALILRGEDAPLPTYTIAEHLPALLSNSRRIVVDGAGHMGPLTHAHDVAALIARHIADAQMNTRPLHPGNADGIRSMQDAAA